MAMPRGGALPVHLRKRPGPLLLTAARLSCKAARTLHCRRYSAGISDREIVRATLHRVMRAPGFLSRHVAGATTFLAGCSATRRTYPNQVDRSHLALQLHRLDVEIE